MPVDPQRIQAVFLAAIEAADPAARAALLARECGEDAELRQRVELLLAAHDQSGSFLNHPAAAATSEARHAPGADAAGLAEGPGSRIGPYKLLQQIGEGGMGVVYMAEQEQPVRRKVALKIIKPGMDSRQVIARFEAERQALALMDHQNIARVLDAGVTPPAHAGGSPRPYFVMELVKGVPITKFCDEQHLTPRERLELFVPVCQAIQHAHQKGIIHRDVKPSNVLVTLYDGKPVPKVIDFGVAKATEQRLTERTLFTQFGQVVGTVEYMSPEQAEHSALDIDTRSDIYSLGVLLYELLTGSTPLEKQRLRSAAFTEMLRMIREEEPPRPSTRLSTSGDRLPSISAQRKTEPAKLAKLVRGELDWIVMKALEKDRGRRYETANGLARDIQRYLADEPVEACPPSAGYKLRKFARKNKKALAVAGAFMLLLVAATAVSAWQAFRATQAEGKARQAHTLAEQEERRAREAETKARQAQTLAEERLALAKVAVDKYLNEVTEDPELKSANFETLRKKLQETAILFYQNLAEQAPGDAERESATGQAYFRLASIRADLGQHAAAVQDYGHARDIFARLADEHPDVPDYHSRLAESRSSLGMQLAFQDKKAEGVAEFRTAINDQQRLADEHPKNPDYRQHLAASHEGLGNVLGWGQENHVQAESEYRIAIEGFRRLADEHPNVPMYRYQLAKSRHELADALSGQGKGAEAEAEYRAALQEHQRMTDKYPKVPMYRLELACTRHALANHLAGLGKSSEAEAEYGAALKEHQRLVDEYPTVPDYRNWLAVCHYRLGIVLAQLGKQAEADAEFRVARKEDQHLLQEYPDFILVRGHLADQHNSVAWSLLTCPDLKLRDPKKAVALAKKAVELAPRWGAIWNTLGVAQYRNGDWKSAIEALMKSAQLRKGGDSFDFFFLAMAHWQLNEKEKARAWYDQAVIWMDKNSPQDEELKRFREEATALLGLAKTAPSQKKKE